MAGLFSVLNVANSGMSVQQSAINVTSHNIANANTEGYSRQRATMETTQPFGMPTLNNAVEPGQIGTGAQIKAIERVRDNFLDYQIRVETGTQGQYQTRDKFLSEVESIINEPSDTGISTLMGKFYDAWQQLSKQPQSSNSRTVVAQQSSALSDELNHTYTQLQKLKVNTQSDIKDQVFQVNDLLNQVDQLNQQIIGVKVAGERPNDLEDKRDLLLDQLSSNFNFNIDKKQFDGYDIQPLDTGGLANASLVKSSNNQDVRRFSYVNSIAKIAGDTDTFSETDVYKVTYYKKGDMSSDNNKVDIYVTGMDETAYKNLDENRVLWADNTGSALGVSVQEDGNNLSVGTTQSIPTNYSSLKLFTPSSGSLKGDMTVQSDVDVYIDQLNSLAKSLAYSVNAIHSGQSDAKDDKMPFFVNKDTAVYDADNKLRNLSETVKSEGKINAGNISVNSQILNNVMEIKTRTHDDEFNSEADNDIDGNTDGSRALAIAQLRDTLIKVQSMGIDVNSRADLFDASKGGSTLTANGLGITSNVNGMTMDTYFKDTVDRLGVQEQEAKRVVTNQTALLSSFQQSKESISGVSLDEEMANLIQFQHAYQANAKVIATVDQLLDVVVNGLIK
ncbi:MAG: flagellar hook-associated protein FlgK [Bacillota bacterium]|nr:flagellar hook-associated protein FlgK [Bacillota bacterium]